MSRSTGETRREFLLTLARAAAFVPPAMATLSVRPLLAQGGGGGGKTTTSTTTTSGSTVGSLSPTAQVISNPEFDLQQQQQSPWSPQTPGQPPPWSRPPPTQTGR